MKSNVEIFKLFKNFERDKLISEFGVESKKFLGTGPLFHKKKIDFENLKYFRRHEIIWLNKTDVAKYTAKFRLRLGPITCN